MYSTHVAALLKIWYILHRRYNQSISIDPIHTNVCVHWQDSVELPSWVRPSGQPGARPGVLGACPRPPTGGGVGGGGGAGGGGGGAGGGVWDWEQAWRSIGPAPCVDAPASRAAPAGEQQLPGRSPPAGGVRKVDEDSVGITF